MKLEVVQVPVSDVDRSIAFYTERAGFALDHDRTFALGRVVQLTPPGSGCSIVLGMSAMAPGSLQGVQLVVEDIEATRADMLARGLEAGEVQVMGPPDVNGAKFLTFEDPDGNGWVVQELRRRGASLVTGVDFVLVGTQDFDAAVAFYGDVLGLPCSARYGRVPGAEFETGSLTLCVMHSATVGIEFRPNSHPIAFHVDDVAATRAELESRGVRFVADTMDTGVCHQAHFRDPDGNALTLHHRYAPR